MNIQSLASLRKKEEESKKNTEYYAGGVNNRGGGSGLAVETPDDRKSDVFSRIVNKAQNVDPERVEASNSETPVTKHKITLYRNGFQVNDGQFRNSVDPENKLFLEQMAEGYVPSELSSPPSKSNSPKPVVDILLDDKRGEDYVAPPPPAYVAYGGQGISLASSSTSSSSTIIQAANIPNQPINLNAAIPSTTLQLKLLNNKKLRLKVNNNHTLGHICNYILQENPQNTSFILAAGYPPRDIENDLNKTVEELNLMNSSIVQKAVNL